MTAIIGPNGAGKSTLLKAALGLIPALKGEVRAFGLPVAQALPRIAYVPQRASVDWEFPARAIDVVLMGLYRQTGLLGRIGKAETARAMDCLARVGMTDFATRQIGALSGGQQQRVFLARALAQGAELYLLDEPFAGVDAATEQAIFSVLRSLRDEGCSIVAVHHDLSTVPHWFDRVLLLNRRAVAEGPVATTFRRALVAETYGSQILSAIPA
jgi:manganese/zinc/iron transport system ATP- binding protein